jgi:hypothetical protein
LHVLGLPLAFILSQDQTLHCKFDIVFPVIHRKYVSDLLLDKASLLDRDARFLTFLNIFKEQILSDYHSLVRKRAAKLQPLFKPPNVF